MCLIGCFCSVMVGDSILFLRNTTRVKVTPLKHYLHEMVTTVKSTTCTFEEISSFIEIHFSSRNLHLPTFS